MRLISLYRRLRRRTHRKLSQCTALLKDVADFRSSSDDCRSTALSQSLRSCFCLLCAPHRTPVFRRVMCGYPNYIFSVMARLVRLLEESSSDGEEESRALGSTPREGKGVLLELRWAALSVIARLVAHHRVEHKNQSAEHVAKVTFSWVGRKLDDLFLCCLNSPLPQCANTNLLYAYKRLVCSSGLTRRRTAASTLVSTVAAMAVKLYKHPCVRFLLMLVIIDTDCISRNSWKVGQSAAAEMLKEASKTRFPCPTNYPLSAL